VVDLRHEAVADLLLLGIVDRVPDVVALPDDLPGDVADQTGQGDEEKLLPVHAPLSSGWGRTRRGAGRAPSGPRRTAPGPCGRAPRAPDGRRPCRSTLPQTIAARSLSGYKASADRGHPDRVTAPARRALRRPA